MKLLFISPHPDDVEFSCLGTLLKMQNEKYIIHQLIVSDCSDIPRNISLKNELSAIRKIVNADLYVDCHLENRRIGTIRNSEELRSTLEGLRNSYDYSIVFTPWVDDIHQDHESVSKETQRVFRYTTILQYGFPHSSPLFHPDVYIPLDECLVNKKLDIIKLFKSQSEMSYANIDSILSTMKYRGLECGHEYAEAFKLWRMIGL